MELLGGLIEGSGFRRRPQNDAPGCHIGCSIYVRAVHFSVEGQLDGRHLKLILAGKCQRVFGDDTGRNWRLNTAGLRRSKHECSGECIPMLVQRQFRRALPLAPAFISGLNRSLPDARDVPRAQKHALVVRTCMCGRKIAGNVYFRHAKACKVAANQVMRQRTYESNAGGKALAGSI